MDAILIVEADRPHREAVSSALNGLGLGVHALDTCRAALGLLAQTAPRMVLAADRLPDGSGGDLLAAAAPSVPVVLMGDRVTSGRLLEAVALGAWDYLAKPVAADAVKELLKEVEGSARLSHRCEPGVVGEYTPEQVIIGACPPMLTAIKTAGLAAKTDATVLLHGESGTGKELFAREIHRVSGRTGAFVPVNCAAVAEGVAESELFGHEKGAFTGAVVRRAGCFEQANGGTLFLDEIGDATPAFQARLLRALDHGEFMRVGGQTPVCMDTRVVAATNRDLEKRLSEGTFRLDLFYRLSAVTIDLPPLRDRREDIPNIVSAMLSGLNRRLGYRVRGVSEAALELLLACDWPGNIRELQHAIHRAVLRCRGAVIQPVHLTGLATAQPKRRVFVATLAEVEEAHIKKVLNITGGNRGRTCQLLGISRPTLRRKIRTYKLQPHLIRDAIQA